MAKVMDKVEGLFKKSKKSEKKDERLVSIVMSAYNMESYIGRAIENCLRQTHTNIELVIVEDVSTDGTLEVISKYTDDMRIRLLRMDNNCGAGIARRVGIKESKGEFVTFCDADDWLEDDHIETLLRYQRKHDAQLIVPGFIIERQGGRKVKGIKEEIVKTGYEKFVPTDPDIMSFLNSFLIDRKLFEKFEYSALRYHEDNMPVAACKLFADKVVAVPYAGYHYRQQPNSLCNTTNPVKEMVYSTLCIIEVSELFRQNQPEYYNVDNFLKHVSMLSMVDITDEDAEKYKEELNFIFRYYLAVNRELIQAKAKESEEGKEEKKE